MAQILIERTPGAAFELVDETALVKTAGVVDDENEYTTWVEYRFPGADRIVHRSAHVTLKKWPEGLGGIAGSFT